MRIHSWVGSWLSAAAPSRDERGCDLSRLRTLKLFLARGEVLHEDFESAVGRSFAVERRCVRVHGGQAGILHYLGVDFVPMRSRLEDDSRQNNGLLECGVDQPRERYSFCAIRRYSSILSLGSGITNPIN